MSTKQRRRKRLIVNRMRLARRGSCGTFYFDLAYSPSVTVYWSLRGGNFATHGAGAEAGGEGSAGGGGSVQLSSKVRTFRK